MKKAKWILTALLWAVLCAAALPGGCAEELPLSFAWAPSAAESSTDQALSFTLRAPTEAALWVINQSETGEETVQAVLTAAPDPAIPGTPSAAETPGPEADGAAENTDPPEEAVLCSSGPLAAGEEFRQTLLLAPGDYTLRITAAAPCEALLEAVLPPALSTAAVTLGVNQKQAVTLLHCPEGAAPQWSSEDSAVATVSKKGVITAQGAGITTVHCAIRDATLDVTVYVPKLSKTHVCLMRQKKQQLTVQYAPEGAEIVWRSASSKIASVKDGKVKAKAAGKTTVVCTVNGVELKAKVYVPKLSRTELTLDYGQKQTLTVKNPGKSKITWSSSDVSVATVSAKGVVKGTGAGKATITAKVKGVGSFACTVTVQPILNETAIDLRAQRQFQLQVLGANGQPVVWSVDDSQRLMISEKGLVYARAGSGEGLVTAKVGDDTLLECRVRMWGYSTVYDNLSFSDFRYDSSHVEFSICNNSFLALKSVELYVRIYAPVKGAAGYEGTIKVTLPENFKNGDTYAVPLEWTRTINGISELKVSIMSFELASGDFFRVSPEMRKWVTFQ